MECVLLLTLVWWGGGGELSVEADGEVVEV